MRTKICVTLQSSALHEPVTSADAQLTLYKKKKILIAWVVRKLYVTEPYR